MNTNEIEEYLFENQDLKYKDFQIKLTPGISTENVIGVRIPIIRKFAKELSKQSDICNFLCDLPHKYYDENNLHGCIVSELKDYEKVIGFLDAFLPYVDNWATCDIISPKVFRKNRDKLVYDIDRWIESDKPFTIRFGIEMVMSHFLDDDFDCKYLEKISVIRSEEYYVNMMIAWFFATALAKQWNSTVTYIENRRLDKWVHNKTIQKAVESYRITDEQKAYLRSMIIK